MKRKQPNLKKALRKLFYITILIGIISVIALKETDSFSKNKEQEVSYREFLTVIEKNKAEKLGIIEMSEGKIYLTIGDKEKDKKNLIKYVTQANPNDSGISELIKKYDITYAYVVPVNMVGTIFNLIFYAVLIAMFWSFIMPMLRSKNSGPESSGTKDSIPKITFDEIGGLSEEVKNEILQTQKLIKNPEKAKTLGLKPSKGILLYGPSGTGKTLIAKAIANSFEAEFIATSGSNFVEMFAGLGAKRARDLFQKAKKNAPAVIFIDEIDAIGKKRSNNGAYSNDEREQTLNQILVLLDGVETTENIFVVAATNRLDILDDALLRPGRFDYKIKIDLPDIEGRKEIIAIHTKNKPLDEEVTSRLSEIAESTSGYSGADIESLFESAGYHAFTKGKDKITMEDINYGIDRVVVGNAGRKIKDKATKERVAYHEAGHAAVSALLFPNSIRKATIVPRGDALGYVAQIPKEGLLPREQLLNHLKMIVAGGVTEKMIFGSHSTGVSDDFRKAKEIIEKMVSDWGMGEKELVPSFSDRDKEKQMESIYVQVIKDTENLLQENNDYLHAVAELLLRKETVDGIEIEALKNEQKTDEIDSTEEV
ncbi:AAA family ATPase [Bacillus thuringiensis]|uniref:AAA family ATPase n=1 Tax=Bacillus thuringiensis TaxID=1428 RepID=UPI0021D6647E|nr:FtsH/Yme1/Tma family ATP-dependent metallopeptidase [Bacillus thuringiensis]MCU7666734.1 AAA family ATPase [Bacillus thuringiensis]